MLVENLLPKVVLELKLEKINSRVKVHRRRKNIVLKAP